MHVVQPARGVRESFPVDLRSWIVADHAGALARFDHAVAAHVPIDRWAEQADGGGASIAWLLLHLGYHQDLAVATAVQGEPPALAGWRDRLGLGAFAPHDGLGEAEQPEVTAALEVAELVPYVRAVHEATATWLETVDLHLLDHPAAASTALEEVAGVTESAVPWLHHQWDGREVGMLVGWEAIGHVHAHVGEMISVRGRMGLSPF